MQVRLLSTTPCGDASASAQVRTPADCVAPCGYTQANYEGAMASVRMFNLLVADGGREGRTPHEDRLRKGVTQRRRRLSKKTN